MGKSLFITEKPSVATEFAKALGVAKDSRKDGYIEDENYVITWCYGHLIEMCYPESYDPSLKKWEMEDLPFLPEVYKYEPIDNTKKQYGVIKKLLNRKDISTIYYSGDSAREGEYIQRLVRMKAGHNQSAEEKRVWIDSQTKEEILHGIQTAKPLSCYDKLSDAGYARAIEDYAVGINFSRAATLKYGKQAASSAGLDHTVVAIGRVMSCVLGMTVDREREIRNFQKNVYYTVAADIGNNIHAKWKPLEQSKMYSQDQIYDGKGFINSALAMAFIDNLPGKLKVESISLKKTKKAAPLLFNLAELQSECSKKYHISPADTLAIAQTLYEKRLTTYPRTDARVLTTAVAKVIKNNINGLCKVPEVAQYAQNIVSSGTFTNISNTKYVNDAAVSDHYAIIPTGETSEIKNLSSTEYDVYVMICRRFLSVFYPAAEYDTGNIEMTGNGEIFSCGSEALSSPGWMEVAGNIPNTSTANAFINEISQMKTGQEYKADYHMDEAETTPPKRYTTGSMILAMENAGKLIEDEELREQIKGTGIGTSATRADTIKKLQDRKYIAVDKKQIITPTFLGEEVYEVVKITAPKLLSPKITASWEKGLSQVESGTISKDDFLKTLNEFVKETISSIKTEDHGDELSMNTDQFRSAYKIQGNSKSNVSSGSSVILCPKCGKPLKKLVGGKAPGSYICTDKTCGFALWNSWCGKKITQKNMDLLLTKGETNLIKGFKTKSGKEFDARLCFNDEWKLSIKK